jgi:hypothetical protein
VVYFLLVGWCVADRLLLIRVILQSFVPAGKQVLRVTVYPSDFGKERMAHEAQYGPQGIWKAVAPQEVVAQKQLRANKGNEDEDYDDVPDSEPDEEDEDEDDNEQELDSEESDDDLESEGGRPQKKTPIVKKSKKESTGFDAKKLRDYELSKLRYYFAVAECDSVETANMLYEELDDVELQDSSMALSLSFVPDDLDLSDREVRDVCSRIPNNYKPPDFVVNALQHTEVKCTWDEGEKDRETKLTNISGWRGMRDSDFMQYIASSDSDDEEEEEEVEEGHDESGDDEHDGGSVGFSVKSINRKKSKAKSLRALLLGDAANDDDSDSQQEADDFFMEDEESGADSGVDATPVHAKKGSTKANTHTMKNGDIVEEEGGDMVLTYIPEAGQELLDKKKQRETELTPFELSVMREADKKKEKKTLRKLAVEDKKKQQKLELDKAMGKIKTIETEEELFQKDQERKRLQKLIGAEHLQGDDELVGEGSTKKEKKNRKRGKAGRAEREKEKFEKVDDNEVMDVPKNFTVDVTDDRFKKVFEGDSAFGIERTAHEFKNTAGMQKILDAQRKARSKKNKKSVKLSGDVNDSEGQKTDMNQLVNRLKRKFQE